MTRDTIIQLFPHRGDPDTADSPVEGGRPVVYTDDQPRHVLQNMVKVIYEANDPPVVFRRAGRLVHLVTPLDCEGPCFLPLNKQRLFRLLIETADWRKRTGTGETPSIPSSRVMDALLETPDDGFPELETVTTVPVFGENFELIVTQGYHADQRVYFHDRHGLGGAPCPRLDPAEARSLLLEAVCDFPFSDDAGRAHAIALLLLPFIRRAIRDGTTPLHIIESASPGSGKGRLADLVSVIATGVPCKPTTLGASSSENAKKLTSLLLAGTAASPIILLDNVPQSRTLDDATLAAFLTTTRPTDRLLGGNQMAVLQNQAVWILTANNLRCTTEMSRRSIWIRIDPQTDRPWLRKGFLHGDLLAWAREHRRRLVQACMSLVLAWIEEGSPRWRGTPLGSFEHWSSVVGGILGVAGIPAFLENAKSTCTEADVETEEWRALACLWWERFGRAPVKASDLLELCLNGELLAEIVGFGGRRSQVSRLGRALNRNLSRVFGRFQVQQEHTAVRSSARYLLTPIGPGSATASETDSADTA